MSHNVYFSDDYVASGYSFDTTRKSANIAASLTDVNHVRLTDPSTSLPDTEELLDRVHDAEYRLAVKEGTPIDLAESQGFAWDPGLPIMATAHSSGLVAAVDNVINGAAVAGSLSSGLHHAKYEHGEGFCTFNGLAVAATRAIDRGAQRVLVLDFDAHAGGGTRSILDENMVTQIDVSTSLFDVWYPTPGSKDRLLTPEGDHDYLDAIRHALSEAGKNSWDFVLYNAGMDPVNTGVSFENLLERERLVFNWFTRSNVPLVYALAGGYTWGDITDDDLVTLHRYTIDTFGEL